MLLDMLRQRRHTSPTEEEVRVYDAFLKIWPNARRVLYSFIRNPSCGSCRAALTEHLTSDAGKVLLFLNELNPDQEWDLRALDKSVPRRMTTAVPSISLYGQVREIDDTSEAYADFMDDLRRDNAKFRGFAVSHIEGGKLRLYFY